MSKDVFVFSTLASDQEYVTYAPGGGDIARAIHSVFIKGGANVMDKRLHTPSGVMTRISADEAEALKTNSVYLMHVENGHITTSTNSKDPDVVAASMTTRDESAPLVDGDFAPVNEGDARPVGSEDPNAPAPQATVGNGPRGKA